MARPKTIKDGVRISVVLSKEQADWVRQMAIRMSASERRQIGVSEAIRMAIEAAYPLPRNRQGDLFG